MELDDAYIAGFFDGEGSIGVYTQNRPGRTCCLRTQVCQNENSWSVPLFNALSERFGGNVSIQLTRSNRRKLNWQLSADRAANFLEVILPYLVIKREQAEIAIAWQRSRPGLRRDAQGRITPSFPVDFARDTAVSTLVKLLKADTIETVIGRQRDLIDIVHTLRPLITLKGDSRAKED